MVRREAYAYSLEQARQIIDLLPSPVREAALLSLTGGLTAAEMRGLRWARVNLEPHAVIVNGRRLPPFSLAVAENFYLGEYGSPKAPKRRRVVPLNVVEALKSLRDQSSFQALDDRSSPTPGASPSTPTTSATGCSRRRRPSSVSLSAGTTSAIRMQAGSTRRASRWPTGWRRWATLARR